MTEVAVHAATMFPNNFSYHFVKTVASESLLWKCTQLQQKSEIYWLYVSYSVLLQLQLVNWHNELVFNIL